MKLVIDANVIISALVKEGKTAELLINPTLQLYAPEFILNEIEKYANQILEKTKRVTQSLDSLLKNIFALIQIVSKEEVKEHILQAKNISPDINDHPYFALALKLSCPIWSNDKKLKEQDKVKIYSTEDLIKEFNL